LICVFETKNSGSDRPPITTCVVFRSIGSGKSAACVNESARLSPKIEMMLPGATGEFRLKLAAFNTPPPAMDGGGLGFAASPPVICDLPVSSGVPLRASIESVAWEAVRVVCHVAPHLPSFRLDRESGTSPVEKLTVTLPEVTAFPQSSATRTSIEIGNAVVALNPITGLIPTGTSRVGVQLEVAPRTFEKVVPGGATISTMVNCLIGAVPAALFAIIPPTLAFGENPATFR
jgi:hypothetical protein